MGKFKVWVRGIPLVLSPIPDAKKFDSILYRFYGWLLHLREDGSPNGCSCPISADGHRIALHKGRHNLLLAK